MGEKRNHLRPIIMDLALFIGNQHDDGQNFNFRAPSYPLMWRTEAFIKSPTWLQFGDNLRLICGRVDCNF